VTELEGTVVAVCIGPGGIPKHAVRSASVGPLGLEGDGHSFRLHGGANRAVCLFSIEDYKSLMRDGVEADAPGSYGENLTTLGLDYRVLRPGDLLRVGAELELEIFDVREPCGTLKTIDRRFPNLMVGRSGWVCRVRAPGEVHPGDRIVRTAAGP